MVILDTNIIIDHIRQPQKTDSHFVKIVRSQPKETFALSIISIQELYIGQSSSDIKKEQYMLMVINALQTLPYTYEVAQKAGEIARDTKNIIQFPDAAIAATAIINGAQLYTLNKKDFQKIPELELL